MIETIIMLGDTKETRRDRRNPYEMHRTLERAFAGKTSRALWRLHKDCLTLRGVEGDGIFEEFPAGYIKGGPARTTFNLVDGSIHGFRLLANPIVTREKKRRNLVGSRNQTGWLVRQGEKHGFRLLDCSIVGSRNHMPKNPKGISIVATEFRGVLEITDLERFEECLQNGIGCGKAFGLGLLKLG